MNKISKFADIETSKMGSVLKIDDSVIIDSFVKIKFTGGFGDIIIGEGTYINSGTVIYNGNGVNIGKNVLIGPNCTISPTNHEFNKKHQLIKQQRFKDSKGGIIIEDDVWLGANVVILDGSIIKKGSVIGALSLVREELNEYGIYVNKENKSLIQIGKRK